MINDLIKAKLFAVLSAFAGPSIGQLTANTYIRKPGPGAQRAAKRLEALRPTAQQRLAIIEWSAAVETKKKFKAMKRISKGA